MPFDQAEFILPVVETDGVLAALIDGRECFINKPDGWNCLWTALAEATAGSQRTESRIAAAVRLAQEVGCPATRGNWGQALYSVYHFHDTQPFESSVAIYDRAISARRQEITNG